MRVWLWLRAEDLAVPARNLGLEPRPQAPRKKGQDLKIQMSHGECPRSHSVRTVSVGEGYRPD